MKKCPLIGKKCLTHDCEFYTHLVGMNPQTGQSTDEWKCAVSWLPLMLIENANMIRHATASTDKVANQVAGLRGEVNVSNQILLDAKIESQKRLTDAGCCSDKTKPEISGDRVCGEQ